MNRREVVVFIFVIAAMISMSGAPAFGAMTADDEDSRATLQGLKGMSVSVIIENHIEELEKLGLLKEVIQRDVEDTIKSAGIPVVSEQEDAGIPGMPQLIVSLGMFISSSQVKVIAYTIQVELRQQIYLARDSKIKTKAGTWKIGGIGLDLLNEGMVTRMRSHIDDNLERFVRAYQSANPKGK